MICDYAGSDSRPYFTQSEILCTIHQYEGSRSIMDESTLPIKCDAERNACGADAMVRSA
jgi:hypothetical protein